MNDVAETPVAQAAPVNIPAIGASWPEQGGRFVGIGRNPDTREQFALIEAEKPVGSFAWGGVKDVKGATSYHDGPANTAAMAAAGSPAALAVHGVELNGHSDWHIPSQAESHLQAANVLQLHDEHDWEWTSTQYGRSTAWIQSFDGGHQYRNYKDYHHLVRPVRRLILRSFNPSV